MTEKDTRKLYRELVCEDPANPVTNEVDENDLVSVLMCIDTSGWNSSLTIIDPSDYNDK